MQILPKFCIFPPRFSSGTGTCKLRARQQLRESQVNTDQQRCVAFNKTKLSLTIGHHHQSIQMIGNETHKHTHVVHRAHSRHSLVANFQAGGTTVMYTVDPSVRGRRPGNKNIGVGMCRDQLVAGAAAAHSISSTVFANCAGMFGRRWSATPLASRRAMASGCLSALSNGRTPLCSGLTGTYCGPDAVYHTIRPTTVQRPLFQDNLSKPAQESLNQSGF